MRAGDHPGDAPVVSLEDLVRIRLSAARPIDHADVEALLAITEEEGEPPGPACGHEAYRREQARLGPRLLPAERLRWLEETMWTPRRRQGRAREAPRERDGGEKT